MPLSHVLIAPPPPSRAQLAPLARRALSQPAAAPRRPGPPRRSRDSSAASRRRCAALVPASNRSPPAATSSTCETAMPTWRLPSRQTTTMICASGSPADRGQHAARILHRQQLPLEVEHRPVADVLDARELEAARCAARRPAAPPPAVRRPPPADIPGSWPHPLPSLLPRRAPSSPRAHGHSGLQRDRRRDRESAPGRRCPAPLRRR